MMFVFISCWTGLKKEEETRDEDLVWEALSVILLRKVVFLSLV